MGARSPAPARQLHPASAATMGASPPSVERTTPASVPPEVPPSHPVDASVAAPASDAGIASGTQDASSQRWPAAQA